MDRGAICNIQERSNKLPTIEFIKMERTSLNPPPPVDLTSLRSHFKTAYKLRDDQVELMIESTQRSLCSSLEAARKLVGSDQNEDFHHVGHTLKGLFLNMGLPEWAAWAKQLELASSEGEKRRCAEIVEIIQQGFKAVQEYQG